jgi:hypothetical protein
MCDKVSNYINKRHLNYKQGESSMIKLFKGLNLGYRYELKCKSILSLYVMLMMNLIGLFGIVFTFIILRKILMWLV